MSIKILSIAKSLPKNAISNDQLGEFLDTSDEWIFPRTGIKSRYICASETLTDLCVDAVNAAINKSSVSISDVDLIICSTLGADYVTPSLACCVGEKLGLSCPSFDINAACSGFIYALDMADSYISTNKASTVLIVCAEMMSKHVDWSDRSTCVLFGDGAAACLVTKGNALKKINLTAKGNIDILNIPSANGNSPFKEKNDDIFLHMQGQEVFKFAVSMIDMQCKKILSELDMDIKDIDYFILHQANKRIIEFARTRLGQSTEKIPVNIENYGNLSSVSIPILLEEMTADGRIKKGSKLLLSAFGSGLTTGTCVMEWE